MIVMDTREPPALYDLLVATGIEISRRALYTADYVIHDRDGHSIGIERKSISDFLGSIADRRIMRQLAQLRRAYKPVLIIEGYYHLNSHMRIVINRRETGWPHLTIQMGLFSIQNAGIRVFWTQGHATTVDVLRGLHQRGEEQCLVGLDEWGMEDDDGGGPESGPDDSRLEPITSLVGAGLREVHGGGVGASKPRTPTRRGAVATSPPSLAIGRAPLPRDGGRSA